MQNNLQELFTLLSFLHPSHSEAMREAAKQLASSNTTEQTIAYTRHVLEPFILRRVKQDVLPELPPKTEVVQRVDHAASTGGRVPESHPQVRHAVPPRFFERGARSMIWSLCTWI